MTITENELRMPEAVLVTEHVRDQLRKRAREYAKETDKAINKLVMRDIREAVEAGRVSARQPRFTLAHTVGDDWRKHTTRGRRLRAAGGGRFVWDEGCSRCYVTRANRTRDGRRGLVVVTVLVPQR
jgi:hypothetical protein